MSLKNDLVEAYRERLMPIHELSNDNDIFGRLETEERKISYIQAGSFFEFLIRTYGEQKLRALHDSPNLDYGNVYGKNLRELEKEWTYSVFGR